MVRGFARMNSCLMTVVIAHVDAVTVDNIVVTRFDFAVTRLAASERTRDAVVSRLVAVARALDIEVT